MRPPRWAKNRVGSDRAPPDTPECGFDGALCKPGKAVFSTPALPVSNSCTKFNPSS